MIHRAVVLAVMIVGSLALLGVMAAGALRDLSGRSLLAMLVVIAGAAVGGIAFSWKRYFPRRD